MPPFNGHALVIGVGEYQDTSWNAPKTATEAQGVADALRSETVGAYTHVSLLTKTRAAKADLITALQDLSAQITPEDTAFIYLAGHGALGTDGEYYFATHDTTFTPDQRIAEGTGLSRPELLKLLHNIQAQKLLLFVNACFSGHVQPTLGQIAPPVTGRLGQPLSPALAEQILATGEGRAIITASRASQYSSYLHNQTNTFFGQAVIDGLNGQGLSGASGYIGLYELYEYIYQRVKNAAAGLAEVQEPVLTLLQSVGPFPVALYQGGQGVTLGAIPIKAELSKATAANIVVNISTQNLDLSRATFTGPVYITNNIAGEAAGAPPRQPCVYISHHASEPTAKALLDVLIERLKLAGFNVLSDPDRLSSADWHPDLYNAMALAHAAILLISPNALTSERVWREARFLQGRHLMGEETCRTSNFRLLRIILDDVQSDQLQHSPLARVKLDALPLMAGATNDELAANVIQELVPFTDKADLMPTRQEALEGQIARLIEKAARPSLELAGHALGLTLDPRQSESAARIWVARGLWRSDVHDWVKAVGPLASYVDDRARLISLFAPAWLDPCAAESVLDVALSGSPRRAIVVNAQLSWFTPRTLVHRAFCRPPDERRLVAAKPLKDQTIEDYAEQIRQDLVKAGLFAIKPSSPAGFNAKLSKKIAENGPVFVVIPPAAPDPAGLTKLIEQFPTPGLTFIVLTDGNDDAAQKLAELAVVAKPDPELLMSQEEDAVEEYVEAGGSLPENAGG